MWFSEFGVCSSGFWVSYSVKDLPTEGRAVCISVEKYMVKFHHQPSAPKYAGAKPGDRAIHLPLLSLGFGATPDCHRLPHLDFRGCCAKSLLTSLGTSIDAHKNAITVMIIIVRRRTIPRLYAGFGGDNSAPRARFWEPL